MPARYPIFSLRLVRDSERDRAAYRGIKRELPSRPVAYTAARSLALPSSTEAYRAHVVYAARCRYSEKEERERDGVREGESERESLKRNRVAAQVTVSRCRCGRDNGVAFESAPFGDAL